MVDLCNKICPFKPNHPQCAKCAQIYSQTAQNAPTPREFAKKTMATQPESIVVEPDTHAIMFTPEIVVAGVERKQCCYMDKCTTVPLNTKCEPICYEPCDSICTGRCRVNPQCPNVCDRIRQEQFKMKYRLWLVQKLNQIKQKYRSMVDACIMKTRLAYVGEMDTYVKAANNLLNRNNIKQPIVIRLGDEDAVKSDLLDENSSSDEKDVNKK
jgi:hypothetical protein